MSFRFLIIFIEVLISGCGINPLAGLGLNTDDSSFRNEYNRASAAFDQQAKEGKITWVQAATKTKETDIFLAKNTAKYDTSWKYDSSDEEYHAYCIALAERLDRRQISFAQYDAARIEKLNQINERLQSLGMQQLQINLQRENQRLIRSNSDRTIKCDTYGMTTTCR